MTYTAVKVLVPVSGGKDSQAALQYAVEDHGPAAVRGLFCDTQFEHPLNYEHVEKLRHLYGVRIDVVTGGSVLGKSLKHKRFPGGGARHCTDELKIRETAIYCKELYYEVGGGFEVWYGMRLDESSARDRKYDGKLGAELYLPHEIMPRKYPKYLGQLGVRFRLPIVEWTTAQVMRYLRGQHNPLYDAGFPRVGCFPCLASGDEAKRQAFEYDDFGRTQYISVQAVAATIGKPIWTSKGGVAENGFGCAVCSI
jgi:3'-phosphoadenosine 5'-phosphosulfate sulfotransferase (PAPS reductase)/FAD synthetase